MKTQLKSMLLPIAVSFIIFIGCQKNGDVPPSASSTAENAAPSMAGNSDASVRDLLSSDKGTPAYMTTTTLTAAGAFPHVLKTGTFVASHELGDTGIYIMNIKFFNPDSPDSIRCTTTFIPNRTKKEGDEWTTISECSTTTNLGKWHVLFGSGVYANLRGNGTVTMVPGHEMATGKISN